MLSESVLINGFSFIFVYDRTNPHYIIEKPYFARTERDIENTLFRMQQTRQYDFLCYSYGFNRTIKSQTQQWAAYAFVTKKNGIRDKLVVTSDIPWYKKIINWYRAQCFNRQYTNKSP